MGQGINKVVDFFHKFSEQESFVVNADIREGYLSFYRQQAQEIRKHLTYERDLSGPTMSGNESVVVKFNIQTYINRFDRYFTEKKIYSGFPQNGYYKLLVDTLIPEKTISDLIPAKTQRRLFLGLIEKTVERNEVGRKIIIKYLWEYISSLEKPLNNVDPDKILEIFKETIGELDKDKESFRGINAQMNNFQKLDILSEILLLNKIRTSKDMKHLLATSSLTGFIIKLFILILLGVFSFFAGISFTKMYPSSSLTTLTGLIQLVILVSSIWIFLFIIIFSSYIYAKTRRKTLFRSITGITKVLQIKPEVLKVFYKNRYLIDYRKIR